VMPVVERAGVPDERVMALWHAAEGTCTIVYLYA
jgi:hypothetical protein